VRPLTIGTHGDRAAGVTVGRLGRRFGLSRSTLLYYHRIGLLVPSSGGDGDYRRYSEADVARLEAIVRYRAAGVPLADIARILDGQQLVLAEVLERRLDALNQEIAELREQQRVIVGILASDAAHERIGVMSQHRWTELLAAAGFSEADMRRWHQIFERHAPVEHREFLRFLCIPDGDIERIIEWSSDAPIRPL
jgi:DNA-binding transcriptional MerR regulator